jgi:hypothetical protein
MGRSMNSSFVCQTLVVACVIVSGCATAPVGRQDLLEFLKDGVSSRDDVRLKLGDPSAQYEDGRILTYRLSKDKGGYILVARRDNWLGVEYSLTLVFGVDGVLQRHSVVSIHSPSP